MNRPRNRQTRQPRDTQGRDNRSRPPRTAYPSSVPNVTQVVSGAPVSIVLKQDQSTGHEVQGIVQDVLTSGNHPRGIKVRLRDGRVGRVQRMALAGVGDSASSRTESNVIGNARQTDESLPPARTLADFIPDDIHHRDTAQRQSQAPTVNCPICGDFEGDEIAVTRHIETHLE